jgi:hypothetical protein
LEKCSKEKRSLKREDKKVCASNSLEIDKENPETTEAYSKKE